MPCPSCEGPGVCHAIGPDRICSWWTGCRLQAPKASTCFESAMFSCHLTANCKGFASCLRRLFISPSPKQWYDAFVFHSLAHWLQRLLRLPAQGRLSICWCRSAPCCEGQIHQRLSMLGLDAWFWCLCRKQSPQWNSTAPRKSWQL